MSGYPALQFTGLVEYQGETYPGIATAEDYSRYAVDALLYFPQAWQPGPLASDSEGAQLAAQAMNAGEAPDTEFFADGAVVTAYVHRMPHMSAVFGLQGGRLALLSSFWLDESRPYPGPPEADI